MYADCLKEGVVPKEYPTQFEEERRQRYTVNITLRKKQSQNPLSGEVEERQVLIVDDSGIGMDRDIIQRYFLQVGRSYYTTDEFRRSFPFVPTSRFGIGFLSVFGASDFITVETYKPSSGNQEGPIKLTLTGPRNYLLTDHGTRRTGGTSVEILLQNPMENGELTRLVQSWCRRVEFPIIVDDLGTQTTIEAESSNQFLCEVPDVTREGAKFIIRSFPLEKPGIEGELYILAYVSEEGEAWDKIEWVQESYPSKDPRANIPPIPESIVCLHGIAVTSNIIGLRNLRYRIDYRRSSDIPLLSREDIRNRFGRLGSTQDSEILSHFETLLNEHLNTSQIANSNEGWKYKQRLVECFPLEDYWFSIPEMIPVQFNQQCQLLSLQEVTKLPSIAILFNPCKHGTQLTTINTINFDADLPFILFKYLYSLSTYHRNSIFFKRKPTEIQWVKKDLLKVTWALSTSEIDAHHIIPDYSMYLTELPDNNVIAFQGHPISGEYDYGCILNKNHLFVKWVIDVKEACEKKLFGLRQDQFKRLVQNLQSAIIYTSIDLHKLINFCDRWRHIPELPTHLYPPNLELKPEFFQLRWK